MLLNEKFNRKVQNLTNKLVSTLTNFEKGSQNHDSCVQYSLSNFYNHRFLTPDGHKIHRKIIGLVEKFLIHSQPEKSICLKEMYDKFLDNDLTRNSFSKSLVHYSLLDVVLNLSSCPLESIYKKNEKFVQSSLTSGFDWAAYLLEDEDNPLNFEWNESPYASDEETTVSQFDETVKDTITPKNVIVAFEQNDQSAKVALNTTDLICSYWNMSKVPIKPVFKCSLNSPLQVLQQRTNITEINVMREVLWLLTGQNNLFTFPEKNGSHSVSETVYLSHLTNEALQNMLSEYAECGDIIKKLKNFIYSVELHTSQTYEAFAYSLSLYLSWLMNDIIEVEKQITHQNKQILLQDLHVILSPHLKILHELSTVYDCSIGTDKKENENTIKSSRLLHILYKTLIDLSFIFNGYGSDSIKLSSLDVIFNLWLDTVRPYMEIIDKWLCKGALDDPKQEFVLRKKNSFDDCQHSQFWYDAVFFVVKNLDEVCPWLCPVLNAIITGGKSMEILQTFSNINRNQNKDLHLKCKELVTQTVYDYFLNELGAKQIEDRALFQAKASHFMNGIDKSSGSELLRLNFIQLLKPQHPLTSLNCRMDKHFNSLKPIPVLVHRALCPIVEIKCNYANHRLVKVFFENFNLLQTLDKFHNFHLMAWGDVMHQFVSSVCNELLTSKLIVNDLIGINIMMQEAATMRSLDQTAFVHLKPMHESEKKNAGLLETPKISIEGLHQSIDITNSIELECKVEWPNNLILSDKCIAVYNRIFSYLFQLKRAVYSVVSLKFSKIYQKSTSVSTAQGSALKNAEATPMSVEEKRHRLSLLRTRILHLLQHWHGFVMTSVIQAEKHVLTFKLTEAKTLDDILDAHDSFLNRICSLCLLDQENQASKLVHGTLKKIMNLAITFNVLWNSGINLVTDRSLIKHETTFHEFSEFLGRILKTIANRGAVPILDSLAYAILS